MINRGILRVYLGSAPGVGKTFSMLSEGLRRADRGTHAVIGALAAGGRLPVIALASRLDDQTLDGALDVRRLLSDPPAVVLIDELAGPASPTGENSARWEDVEELLAAGCDVVTTLNVSELDSLTDVVRRITGQTSAYSVPDRFVRRGQVEAVDMTPESLRRRLAHGNVYSADVVDAELADFFRVGNLTALRELVLSWLADRVEENLDAYVAEHLIADAWETRERIVVALTGADGADTVIRRAGRLAARTKAPLIGVHVVATTGLGASEGPILDAHRRVLESLGGVYREIVGDDVSTALIGFARSERATQLVIGASPRTSERRGGRSRTVRPNIVNDIVGRAEGFDVHVVRRRDVTVRRLPVVEVRRLRRPHFPLLRRERGAWLLLIAGMPALIFVLLRFPNRVGVSAVLLILLPFVVVVAALGGRVVGVTAAVAAFLSSNWYFVPPKHTLAVASAENAVALIVFVGAAASISALIDRIAVRSAEAFRARAEAETLARTTATIAGERDPLDHLMAQICSSFDVEAAAVLSRIDDRWERDATFGEDAPRLPADGLALPLDEMETGYLVLRGSRLSADDHRVLRTIASQLRLALDARQYQDSQARLDALAEANAVRTAMLQAVSHDLRTPLAGIKASASSLLSTEVVWTDGQRHTLLTTIDRECDRLNRIVGNLLDMSRLQAGAVEVRRGRVEVDQLVENALASLPDSVDDLFDVHIEVGMAVDVDATLMERAIANVIANAARHTPPGSRVRIEAVTRRDVMVRVVDRGPGISAANRGRVFEPFQRLGDGGGAGVGLGLAVARGLTVANGGWIELDDTPGGGLSVTFHLPRPTDDVTDDLTVDSTTVANSR